jgi:hypothetical protein
MCVLHLTYHLGVHVPRSRTLVSHFWKNVVRFTQLFQVSIILICIGHNNFVFTLKQQHCGKWTECHSYCDKHFTYLIILLLKISPQCGALFSLLATTLHLYTNSFWTHIQWLISLCLKFYKLWLIMFVMPTDSHICCLYFYSLFYRWDRLDM